MCFTPSADAEPSVATIAVRLAAPKDAAGLARVRIDAWRHAYSHFIDPEVLERLDLDRETARWTLRTSEPHPEEPLWVAVEGDEVLGFIVVGPNRFPSVPCDAELHAIYVHPSAQRRGVGRLLVSEGASWLVGRGFTSMVVFAFRDNSAGVSFYRSLGGEFYDNSEFEVGGKKYPDESYVWKSLQELEERLAKRQTVL